MVASQPVDSSLRFSCALGGGGTGAKEELAAFLRSTSPTDMLRRLPGPVLIGIMAARTGLTGDCGRGCRPEEDPRWMTMGSW